MFWSDQNGCAQDVREGWWGTDTASYFREGKGAEREVGGTKPTQHSTPIFQTPQPPRQMGFCGSQETGLAFGGGGVRGTQQRRLKRTEQVGAGGSQHRTGRKCAGGPPAAGSSAGATGRSRGCLASCLPPGGHGRPWKDTPASLVFTFPTRTAWSARVHRAPHHCSPVTPSLKFLTGRKPPNGFERDLLSRGAACPWFIPSLPAGVQPNCHSPHPLTNHLPHSLMP